MIENLEMMDRSLLLAINTMHTPLLDTFMWYISKTWPTVFVVLAVAFAFYKKYSAKKAVEFLVGCALIFACTDMSSNLIKHGVKRYRPTHNLEIREQVHVVNDYHGGKYSFVSGHAANTFGTITFIFLCIHWVQRRYKVWLFLLPVVVCYSRMYLGVHYPSDILCGTAIGLLFGIIGYYLMNLYFLKLDGKEAA